MKAVIFDLDGTLLDVREGFYWQFQELSRHYDGAPISRGMIDVAMHSPTEQIIRSVVRNQEVPFDVICKHYEQLRHEADKRFLKLYEGVDELLPILTRMGIKVAALTTGDYPAEVPLRQMGIHHHFDVVITGKKVSQPKPHPEGLYLLLEELGENASDVVVVGDSVVDILLGKNAGAGKTVGISHGFGHVAALQAAGADHIIHDIPSLLDVLE